VTSSASPEELLTQAAVLHRSGKLAEAAAIYNQVLAFKPDFPEVCLNLGNVLTALGTFDQAVACYRNALTSRPDFWEAMFGLGNALKAQGKLESAVTAYRSALAHNPDFPPALYNLGGALVAQGKRDQAVTAFTRTVALKPDFFQAHNNLGILYYENGLWDQAESAFVRALALQPDFPKAQNNLGMVFKKRNKLAEAEASFREAIRLKPDYIEAYDNLGALLLELGRTEQAFEEFMRRSAIQQPPGPDTRTARPATHDREQAEFRGRLSTGRVEIQGGERLPAPAINIRADTVAIDDAWRNNRPQIVVIDDLLTPEALEGLRQFCHGSTIWRDTFDGYLGARPQSGFACPLLGQVAKEFANAYPVIFREHPLLFAWAFKYDQGMRGTKVHADFASVNVNFWITPDAANEDPDTGGLLVWDVAAPLDWDFAKYNANDAAIREFLKQSGAKAIRIPYRANRAVVFDSDLFHETDVMSFRPGYTNRRINITLLYGSRSRGPLPEI
jgi:tetratricopeptide (TPR) repeat protein